MNLAQTLLFLELTNPCPQEDFVLTKLEFEKTYVIGTK